MRVVSKPAAQEPAQRLYTVADAAAQLDTGKDYVYDRIKAGDLRIVELGTNTRKKIRVRADDLQLFIDARTHGRRSHLSAVHA